MESGAFFMLKNRIHRKKKTAVAMIVITLVFTIFLSYQVFFRNNETEALSKYGSRGEEVRQIQTKLKRWGYYNGNVDGIYGSQTQKAVRWFQSKNGLAVDGIAGKNTLAAMGIFNSSNSSSSSSNNSNNLNLLARLVYGEARGEPYTGQVAVAAVVLNRVRNSSFPNTIAGVIYQSGAFDVVADGQINLTPNSTAIKAAQDALNGWDPTYGAIYYFNPKTATNKWIWSRPMTVTIGNHRFCK
jgi:N-acetylmuramoyl-L-alanine amidase